MPKYKLTYFDGRGNAEVIRLIFAQAGVNFEDVRVDEVSWPKLLPKTPTGLLPILEVDGNMYFESNAISRYLAKQFGLYGKDREQELLVDMVVDYIHHTMKPILALYGEEDKKRTETVKKKYQEETFPKALQNLEKMLVANNGGDGFFVGDGVTWADLMFLHWGLWPTIDFYKITIDFSKIPKLEALIEKVKNLPNIAAWLKKRPETEW